MNNPPQQFAAIIRGDGGGGVAVPVPLGLKTRHVQKRFKGYIVLGLFDSMKEAAAVAASASEIRLAKREGRPPAAEIEKALEDAFKKLEQ
jgi:hypothetical protein